MDYNLGSISAIVDGSGNLLSEQRYMPFGEVRPEVGTISQTDFGYTGQRDLPMLSIMDYNARFCDPGIGRFIQPDTIIPSPANPQSWNRYSYVRNDPVMYSDPSGHSWQDCDKRMNGYQCKVHLWKVHTKTKITEYPRIINQEDWSVDEIVAIYTA